MLGVLCLRVEEVVEGRVLKGATWEFHLKRWWRGGSHAEPGTEVCGRKKIKNKSIKAMRNRTQMMQ